MEKETSGDGCASAGDNHRTGVCSCEERGRRAVSLEELPEVKIPCSEGAPTAGYTAEYERDLGVEGGERNERRFGDVGFYDEEQDADDESDDQREIDVGLSPADGGCLVPREIDEDESDDAGRAASDVQVGDFVFDGSALGGCLW